MAGMSRVVTVVIVVAVAVACSLILLYVFRGHRQPGTVVYDGRTYDCGKVLRSFDTPAGPGVYPQPVFDACMAQ